MPSLSVDVDNDGNLIKFNPVTISPVSDDKLNSYSNYLSRYGLIVVNLDEAIIPSIGISLNHLQSKMY